MSLFISAENQNLLYDMIHKTPEINSVFSNLDAKNEWFRGIIERHYRQMPASITREELKNANRQVLGYMVGSLRTLSITPPTTSPINYPKNLLKREQTVEPPAYRSVFDTPKPTPIDFTEKIEDEVITNMNELIENQRRMRDRELQEYAPPSPIGQPVTPAIEPNERVRVNILGDLPKEVLQPIEKSVQFDLPLISEIEKMKKKMETIENKLDDTMNMIREFMSGQKPSAAAAAAAAAENPVSTLKQLIASTATTDNE